MKKSDLRRLVAEYKKNKIKYTKTQNNKLKEKLKEIEYRYFHETGKPFVPNTKEIT